MNLLKESEMPQLMVPESEDPMQMSPDIDRSRPADEDIDIDLDLDAGLLGEYEDDDMDGQNGSTTEVVDYRAVRDDDMVDEDKEEDKGDDQASLIDEDLYDADHGASEDSSYHMTEDIQRPDLQKHSPSANSQKQHQVDAQQLEFPKFNQPSDGHIPNETIGLPEKEQTEDTRNDSSYMDRDGNLTASSTVFSTTLEDSPRRKQNELDREDILNYEDNLDEIDDNIVGHTELSSLVVKEQPEDTADTTGLTDIKGISFPSAETNDSHPPDDCVGDESQQLCLSLHPVIVIYQGNEMSLFPSTEDDNEQSQTYLLEHQSVASESIGNLLQQCRLVLADSIGEPDELEIRFTDLGLNVDETSTGSLETTLEQILELYLHLSHNDGLDNPDPLYVELCVKSRCSHRLEYLLNAVAEDKGLSDLEFPHIPEGVNDEAGSMHRDEDVDDAKDANRDDFPQDNPQEIQERNSRRSQHDSQNPANAHPASEADPHPQAAGIEPNNIEIFEASDKESGALRFPEDEKTAEPAAEDGSAAEFSDEELFNGESSAGSSTLQGDTLDCKVPTTKAWAPESDASTAGAVSQIGEASNISQPANAQRPLEGITGAGEGALPPSSFEESHAYLQDRSFLDNGTNQEPEHEIQELDVFENIETYEEADNQAQSSLSDDNKQEHGEPTREEIGQYGNTSQLNVDRSDYVIESTPNEYVKAQPTRKLSDAPKYLEVTDGTAALTGESHDGASSTQKNIDESIAASEGDDLHELDQRSSRFQSSYSALDEDEIVYDDDIEETPLANQDQTQSSHSLKRPHDSIDAELETNKFPSDIKRARSS